MSKKVNKFVDIFFLGADGKISYTALGGMFVLVVLGSVYYMWMVRGEVVPAMLEWSLGITEIFILGRAAQRAFMSGMSSLGGVINLKRGGGTAAAGTTVVGGDSTQTAMGGGIGNLADANYATPHFKMADFDCNDGTPVPREFYPTVMMLMQQLEIIRAACGGRRIFIESGYRTPAFNATVPGAGRASQHLFANAADIIAEGMQPMAVYRIVEQLMDSGQITQGGIGLYNSHVHYDQRGTKTNWDAR